MEILTGELKIEVLNKKLCDVSQRVDGDVEDVEGR